MPQIKQQNIATQLKVIASVPDEYVKTIFLSFSSLSSSSAFFSLATMPSIHSAKQIGENFSTLLSLANFYIFK